MILLHHCCVVCTPKALEFLRKEFGKAVSGLWYNPNIMPEEEHSRRLNALKEYAAQEKHALLVDESIESGWVESAKKEEAEGRPRCAFCYYVRMKRTAQTAVKNGIPRFTTTLLSSPHQKHELVIEAGKRAASESGAEFYYRDFRPQFYEGKNEIYKRKLYMQKYCGCPASGGTAC